MGTLVTEEFTLLGIALAVIISRTCWRFSTVGFTGLKADDYLMMVAACAYSAETYLAYSVGQRWHGLANNGMTDEERRLLDPSSEEYSLRVGGSKTQLAGWNTYTFLLWTLKSAMCTYYIRLTDGLDFTKRIIAGFALIAMTWVAAHLSILLGCLPLRRNWQIYPDPGISCQPAISRSNVFVVFVLNVATDIYLLTIPIPMLWASSIKPFKKAALIVMFSGGIFVTIAGTLRAVLIITNPVTGAQQAGSWAIRETFVAVITTNIPIVFPMFRLWLTPVINTEPKSDNPLPAMTTFSTVNESEERLNHPH
ncbi:hypothetical protein PG997_011492 [Apiospora hydei]|uniref:Rhodopsin domain-containing protein n=1 Tax=Apiospora hydei TaxID=1337664 RepID=A0ABR1VJ83_9PEZI